MSRPPLTTKRAKLLSDLEHIVGNNCYNGNIQNRGPGGVYEGSGREFRYPLTLRDTNNEPLKRRGRATEVDFPIILSGYYAFGSNKLGIVDALDQVLAHLEAHYDLKL